MKMETFPREFKSQFDVISLSKTPVNHPLDHHLLSYSICVDVLVCHGSYVDTLSSLLLISCKLNTRSRHLSVSTTVVKDQKVFDKFTERYVRHLLKFGRLSCRLSAAVRILLEPSRLDDLVRRALATARLLSHYKRQLASVIF